MSVTFMLMNGNNDKVTMTKGQVFSLINAAKKSEQWWDWGQLGQQWQPQAQEKGLEKWLDETEQAFILVKAYGSKAFNNDCSEDSTLLYKHKKSGKKMAKKNRNMWDEQPVPTRKVRKIAQPDIIATPDGLNLKVKRACVNNTKCQFAEVVVMVVHSSSKGNILKLQALLNIRCSTLIILKNLPKVRSVLHWLLWIQRLPDFNFLFFWKEQKMTGCHWCKYCAPVPSICTINTVLVLYN